MVTVPDGNRVKLPTGFPRDLALGSASGLLVSEIDRIKTYEIPLIAMRAILPVSVALLLASCSYGKPPIRIIGGKRFPVETARQLTVGTSDAEVRAQLGEPLRVSSENSQEVWHYAFETQHKERIRFLGIIPWPAKEHGGKLTATLAFRNHALSSVNVTPVQ